MATPPERELQMWKESKRDEKAGSAFVLLTIALSFLN
jgi:hypothetical protein